MEKQSPTLVTKAATEGKVEVEVKDEDDDNKEEDGHDEEEAQIEVVRRTVAAGVVENRIRGVSFNPNSDMDTRRGSEMLDRRQAGRRHPTKRNIIYQPTHLPAQPERDSVPTRTKYCSPNGRSSYRGNNQAGMSDGVM